MKKCCFILLYFGRMPSGFPLFLRSCRCNPSFDWLIITDDRTAYDYPDNVHCHYCSFGEIRQRLQSFFAFPIALSTPYKLCDFRPAYGMVFEEELRDYRYWGYCDNDVIFGDLEHFLSDAHMENYDKLFCLGHLVVFRNTEENNRIFLSEGVYRDVFTTEKNQIFDECYCNRSNIHDLFLRCGKRVYEKDLSANFDILSTNFVRITFQSASRTFVRDAAESLYVWDNGRLLRYYQRNGELETEDLLYIHLQERIMRTDRRVLNAQRYKIVPNAFLPLETDCINAATFPHIRKKTISFHLLRYHCKWKLRKLKRLFRR